MRGLRSTWVLWVAALCIAGPAHRAAAGSANEQREEEFVRLDRQGMFAMAHDRYVKAEQAWEKALALKPDSVDMINKVGIAQTKLKKFGEAEQSFRRAIARDDNEPKSYFNLGLLFLHQGQYEAAELWLGRALGRADWYPETHYHLGYIQEKRGEYEKAAEEYVAELGVNPASVNAWYGLLSLKKRGLIPSTYELSEQEAADWSPASVAALAAAFLLGLCTWGAGEIWGRKREKKGTPEYVEW